MRVKGAFPVRWAPKDGEPGKGVTVKLTSIQYAASTSGTSHPTSGWGKGVPAVGEGNYLWTWTHIEYSDGTKTDAYSVARMGIDGKGIQNSEVTYSQKEKAVQPETITDWGAFPSTLTDGWWLYTKTHLVYSDGSATDSYSVAQIGVGSYYAGVAEYYKAGASATTVPDGAAKAGTYANGETISTSWGQTRPTLTEAEPYLWNFEISADSRGNKYVTEARCIGNFAKGITSIVEAYALSNSGSLGTNGLPTITGTWEDEPQDCAPTAAYPYQWNRTTITYNNGDEDVSYHVSAVRGLDGKGAVYIDLDNENDTMLYDQAGTLISGTCRSNISLYDNGRKVGNPPTFSIQEKSASVSASIAGSVLTVSGITSNGGYVIVQCVYNNATYTARFTVKRLTGADKYEVEVNTNSVTLNTSTGTLTNNTVQISVYRTSQDRARYRLVSASAINSFGITAKVYPNGASANAVSLTFNASGYASYTISGSNAAAWNNFAVVIFKDGVEQDRESIPIGKVANGEQGPAGADARQYTLRVTGTRHSDSGTARSSYSVDGRAAVSNITAGGRGLTLLVFDADGAEDASARETFDTYGDTSLCAAMVTKLQGLHDSAKVIAITSMDAIVVTAGLQAELKNFGCNSEFVTGTPVTTTTARTAFAVIGQYGMQPGTAYYGNSSSSDITLQATVNKGVLTARGDQGEKGEKGEKGDPGAQGLQGCIQRLTEWTAGVEFHNDEALTSGTRYLDIAVITGETSATFLAFKCLKTHVATTANAPKAGATTTEWQPLNNMAPIYTPLILAQYALLKFAQTNRLLIMKEDGTINAALGGGRWPLWIGGNSADEAPFAVDRWGNTKEAAALIPATNGANSYIVEDKGRMVFAPSSDMSSATFNVHLPNDSEYIGRRITVIVQPQIMSSGTTSGGAVAKITTGDRFVNCLYGGGTEKANVELIEAIGGDEKGYLDGLQYFGGGYVKAGTNAELPQTISLKNGHVELLGIEERVKNLWRTEVASGNGARWKAGIVRDSAGLIIDAESTGGFMETTEAATEWEQEGDGYTRMCRWVVVDHTGAEFA